MTVPSSASFLCFALKHQLGGIFMPNGYCYTLPMKFPLTPLEWLTAPPLFAQPADGLPHLLPQFFTDEEFIGPDKDQRLGRRFEALILTQLQHQPHLELVLQHHAFRDNKRTLGEIDALLYHRLRREYWHWEFTFKHYLGVTADYWPGPNPNDHFHRKYQHGLTHQFPLVRDSIVQQQLPGPIAQQHLISRGVLYYPAATTLAPPQGAAPQHLRGLWWSESQLPTTNRYLIMPKYYWLNGQQLLDQSTQWLSAESVIRHLHQVNCPTLLLIKHATQGFTPGFVVPNCWLNHVYK